MAERGDRVAEERRRLRGLPAMVLAAVLLGILVSALAVSFLANNVRREVDALAVANSDTTQWTLVQAEVELMALLVAVHEAYDMARPDLAEVRRRYDVFYSRVRLIEESRQFADLRADPEAAHSIALLDAFLARTTAMIDGPDAGLTRQLPALLDDLKRLRATGRDFSLQGVRFYAEDSDLKREAVAATLAQIGYVTLSLVLALLAGIAVLMAMYRRSLRTERSAAEARNRLEEVIATSLDGIIGADADGRVVEWNGAAERVFGYSRAEALGRDIAELIIPDHLRAAHRESMTRYHATGERRMVGGGLVRLEARRKDGTVFPVELSLSAATYGGREIFVSFLRDISDRVAAEQELIHARDRAVAGERAKADLLAVMSHEMRTPLNGLLGTIELLQATRLTERQERFLAAMKTSAGLLLHHVNGVLGMSRAEAGQLDLAAAEIDPAVLLHELVESQRHAIEANGNKIRCDASTAPPRIWADPLRLRQVILNLVGNANKFTRRGEILVECDSIPDRHEVEFRVIDTGIGIAEENLEVIFEEFRTLDTSYSRPAEGTGLGLAISRRLVKAMGGEIGVESEPGDGSLFWVRLPIGAPAGDGSDRAAEALAPPAAGVTATGVTAAGVTVTGPLRVLLVEDNQINRLVAREMLRACGHEVAEAHNGREGLRLAEMHRFDAILMDISMPDMDGVAATRAIRSGAGPNRMTPIIALTAHALPEDTRRFLAAGITTAMVKPLSRATLQQALAGVQPRPAEARVATTFCDLAESLGRERAALLLEAFQAEAEALVARMGSAEWEAAGLTARADAVHRLAGSAAVLGAGALLSVLQRLEDGLRGAGTDAAALARKELTETWAATRVQIRDCLDSLAKG